METTFEQVYVLGIDPGLTRCGYGLVVDEAGTQRALAAGVITTPPSDPLPKRLASLRSELVGLIFELAPGTVVVERVFFQTNAKTAMFVAQAAGLALASAAEAGVEIAQYSANEVKLAVAGYGAASKEQVQEMVARLLRLAEVPRPADAADALGLALCHLSMARKDRLKQARSSASRGVLR